MSLEHSPGRGHNSGQLTAPILCSINETARLLGVGRTKIYDLIAKGFLESVHLDQRHLVKYRSILRYAEELAG